MTRRVVVMVAKAPVAGNAKTRLAASIGDEAAVALAAAFIADLTHTITQLDATGVIAWAGEESHPAFDRAREAGFMFWEQGEGDLGDRLARIFRRAAHDFDEIIVIGSDSPTLTTTHFQEAWASLEAHDAVIGPSFDGGYYLLGLKPGAVHADPLFAGVSWSTSDVLSQTLRRCRASGVLCDLIRFCYDVDTLDDLKLLKTHLLEHLTPSGLDVAQNTAILLSDIPTD